jgi:hypothetical protein
MNRWVLKKLSKDVVDQLTEYIKNIKQKITTYVRFDVPFLPCMSGQCDMTTTLYRFSEREREREKGGIEGR